jgi:tetratricopeptide (TPR) repeat protein
MDKLGLKYDCQPNGLVRVEALHDWVDFSVRTIGFKGFTALGACFGNFITLVSPGDRDVRRLDFMWSATVWHEYAHVLTLALSKARVPRWLTEGFSVHEEHARNKAWERGMDRQLFDYWHNDQIYPVRELNRAFRGPDILFGYYQGGLIVDFLAGKHGFDKVVQMLTLYGEDTPEEQIFERTFGTSTARFDREFKQWVWDTRLANLKLTPAMSDARFTALLARVNVGQGALADIVELGWACAARGNDVDAARFVRTALGKQPEHGPALLLHAELMRKRQAIDDALATWARAFATGSEDFDSRLRYAEALEKKGDLDGALQQYQLAKRCWPRCTEQAVAPSLRVARVLRKLERGDEAMAELASFTSLTGRAFAPRLELAEFYRDKGERRLEAKCLEEANQIDPFMRALHERLGDAYVALGRKSEAAREYRVAMVVPSKLDRAYLDAEEGPPDDGAPEVRVQRGHIALKLARVWHELLEHGNAAQALEQARTLAPDTEVSEEAERLQEAWRR